MQKIPSKKQNKSDFKNYIIKAEEFLLSAQNALFEEKWNAVGLNSVHAVISANDALCIFYKGQRCTSQKHSDAVKFLTFLSEEHEFKQKAKHLSWLILRKNLVEYESRLFFQKEAIQSAKHAERFIEWVKIKLP